MNGVAVLVGVRPSGGNDCLRSVSCFEEVVPRQCGHSAYIRVRLRNAKAGEDEESWLSDRDFGIALVGLFSLTSAELQHCESVAGDGMLVSGGVSALQWVSRVDMPSTHTDGSVMDISTLVISFDKVLVDSVGLCLRLLLSGLHADFKRRNVNAVLHQLTTAQSAYPRGSMTGALDVAHIYEAMGLSNQHHLQQVILARVRDDEI